MKAKKREFKPTKSECAFIGAFLFVSFFVLWFLFGTWLKDFEFLCWIEKRPGFWAFLQALAAIVTLVSTAITWYWQISRQKIAEENLFNEKEKLNTYKKYEFRKFLRTHSVFQEIELFTKGYDFTFFDRGSDIFKEKSIVNFFSEYDFFHKKYQNILPLVTKLYEDMNGSIYANENFQIIDELLYLFKGLNKYFGSYDRDSERVNFSLDQYRSSFDQELHQYIENELNESYSHYKKMVTKSKEEIEHIKAELERIEEIILFNIK